MQGRKNSCGHISVLQLKNIVARISDNINMHALTIAIRQQCLEEQQTNLKDQFLTFFLRCEGKLKKYGNCEWNRVINGEIKKMVGFENMQMLMRSKMLRNGFGMIQRIYYLDEQSKVEQKLYDQFSDLRDMQISDEVKVKTKFFFKWCKFIEDKKAIKRMREKEIEDLKKSKVFHQYSVKFQTFMEWKQYIKRIKTTRQRGILLEQKTKKNKIATIFSKIKEKTQIITIEKLLEEAVELKMERFRNKNVFQKLQVAMKESKHQKKHLQRKKNIWLYRFFHFMHQKGTPLMNTSSVLVRRQIADEYSQTCLQTSMKGLKILMNQTRRKIQNIKLSIKGSNFKKFVQIQKYLKKSVKLKRQITLALKKSFFSEVMKSMVFKSSFQRKFEEKKRDLQLQMNLQMLKKVVKNCMNFKAVKVVQDKKIKQIEFYLEELFKKRIFKNLKGKRQKKQKCDENIVAIRCFYLINLMRRKISSFKEWRKQSCLLKAELDSYHEKRLRKKALKGLKMAKYLKKSEKQTLKSIVKLLQNKVKAKTFEQLQNRYRQLQKLSKLTKCSENILVKMSFMTILNRMLSKKMKMKTFAHKQDNKLKKKLLDLLKRNTQMMAEGKDKAKQLYKVLMKKSLLNQLKYIKTEKQKEQEVEISLMKKRKNLFYNYMRNNISEKIFFEDKQEEVCLLIKSIKFTTFIDSGYNFIEEKRDKMKKIGKIQRNSVRFAIKTLRRKIQESRNIVQIRREQQKYFQQLIQKMQYKMVSSALKTMHRLSDSSLNSKFQMLYKMRFQQIVKLLCFNKKKEEMKRNIQSQRSEQTIHLFQEDHRLENKYEKLAKRIKKIRFVKSLSTIKINLNIDQEEEQSKIEYLVDHLKRRKQKNSKAMLINRMKYHFQLKENMNYLMNQRLRQNCQEMIKLYLKQKSSNLKQFMALRHYAGNVKRKAMRGLKRSVNICLLKQNRTQVQHNSKVLVERSIDNVRKKSKLIQTIERYNMSRVSRVIR